MTYFFSFIFFISPDVLADLLPGESAKGLPAIRSGNGTILILLWRGGLGKGKEHRGGSRKDRDGGKKFRVSGFGLMWPKANESLFQLETRNPKRIFY
jgi:hypothetical protein